MDISFVNIALGFLEGLGLIISPCILPILPIILAGSLEGGKKRPIGIIVGFVLIFVLFTFFSRKIVQYTGIDLTWVRYVSYVILILFAIVMLSETLTNLFSRWTQRFAEVGSTLTSAQNSQGGFFSGVLFGSMIAFVWTPCAGPILAAVIVQTVIQQTTLNSFLVILAFGIGAAIPMLAIALFGRAITDKITFFKIHGEFFRKLLGLIILLAVAYMYFEQGYSLTFAQTTSSAAIKQDRLVDGLLISYPAPKIDGITEWINSPPLTLDQLKGKVILIDFWTYSCINCLRTLPYLKDWYAKYHDKGFEIIGVHSPEFDFEKNLNNVKQAVVRLGIKYPVALDNQFVTWQNYNNQYWPAHYLIDKQGNVVYQHFGEGQYAETENNIRFLLGMNSTTETSQFGEEKGSFWQTPETYLGYLRMRNYAGQPTIIPNQSTKYTFPASLPEHNWALQGNWKVNKENIVATEANAALEIHFKARKVFVVMANPTGFPVSVKVTLNGKVVMNEKGKDVTNGEVVVKDNRLYEVVVLPEVSDGILQLTVSAPGLEIYTFTFGG